MHREFRTLLDAAKGSSEFAIVVNIDIRNFSAFSRTVESIQVAVFMKRVYRKLIDDYFSHASFYKPTGDGLLVVAPYEDDTLQGLLEKTVETCLRVHAEFGTLCAGDPMVNFDVPQTVGIGVVRGSTTRMVAGDEVLDYSGAVLNLATRLMDLARPSGVVLDGSIGVELLTEGVRQEFARDQVYIRGIAERTPIEVLYTKKYTQIHPLSKKPIDQPRWEYIRRSYTFAQLKRRGKRFYYDLPSEPRDPREATLTATFRPVVKGRVVKDLRQNIHFGTEYKLEAGRPRLYVDMKEVLARLKTQGVKDRMSVEVEIAYPQR